MVITKDNAELCFGCHSLLVALPPGPPSVPMLTYMEKSRPFLRATLKSWEGMWVRLVYWLEGLKGGSYVDEGGSLPHALCTLA